MPLWVLVIVAPLLAQRPTPPADTALLDFAFYRPTVQPIFLEDRRPDEGSGRPRHVSHEDCDAVAPAAARRDSHRMDRGAVAREW
jgi:hypothetical protein